MIDNGASSRLNQAREKVPNPLRPCTSTFQEPWRFPELSDPRKHLVPRFGETQLAQLSRQHVQAYVAHLVREGYAPKTIDHIHDVLSAVLRTAVKWGRTGREPRTRRSRSELARQAGLELGGSLEVFDVAHPAGQWFHLGKIWATISKLLILND
jgi:hypothetical protein